MPIEKEKISKAQTVAALKTINNSKPGERKEEKDVDVATGRKCIRFLFVFTTFWFISF